MVRARPGVQTNLAGPFFWLSAQRCFDDKTSIAEFVARRTKFKKELSLGFFSEHFDGCHIESEPVAQSKVANHSLAHFLAIGTVIANSTLAAGTL